MEVKRRWAIRKEERGCLIREAFHLKKILRVSEEFNSNDRSFYLQSELEAASQELTVFLYPN